MMMVVRELQMMMAESEQEDVAAAAGGRFRSWKDNSALAAFIHSSPLWWGSDEDHYYPDDKIPAWWSNPSAAQCNFWRVAVKQHHIPPPADLLQLNLIPGARCTPGHNLQTLAFIGGVSEPFCSGNWSNADL